MKLNRRASEGPIRLGSRPASARDTDAWLIPICLANFIWLRPDLLRCSLSTELAFAFCMVMHYNELVMAQVRLPSDFCWSRFGTESGQTIERILARKEGERLANGGTFLWGIGNALGPGIRELLRRQPEPEVFFSPIKSRPRQVDVSPNMVVAWTMGETLEGDVYELPRASLVLSRFDPDSPRGAHYALVCQSATALGVGSDLGELSFGGLRNILSGRELGSSQVTAVVSYNSSHENNDDRAYRVAFGARLVYPFFVRLLQPVDVAAREARLIA